MLMNKVFDELVRREDIKDAIKELVLIGGPEMIDNIFMTASCTGSIKIEGKPVPVTIEFRVGAEEKKEG